MNLIDRIANKIWRVLHKPKAKIVMGEKIFKVPRLMLNNFYKASYQSEKWLSVLLKKIHAQKSINTCIDAGVNIGQTLLKIKEVNNEVLYFGFEPNPFCVAINKEIILINRLNDCHIIPCGLGNENSIMKLSLSNEENLTDSSASIIKEFRSDKKDQQSQFVLVSKLDDILLNIPIEKIDLLKIDIEGAELEAIHGMINTLKKHNPIIIIEVLPSYEESNRFRIERQGELASILLSLNYKIFQIKNKEKNMFLERVENFPVHNKLDESDYILLPNDINADQLGIQSSQ